MKIPDGVATTAAYFVKLDEDVWNMYTSEFQKECKEYWILAGENCEAEECVLKLVPDPLLAISGKEIPYVAWRHRFSDLIQQSFKVSMVTVHIEVTNKIVSAPMMEEIMETVSKYEKGTKWRIWFQSTERKILIKEGYVK